MFVINVYKELYEQVAEEALMQNDVTIVEVDDINFDSKELLKMHGISFDEVIHFQPQDDSKQGGGIEITPAHTSFYLLDKRPKVVIFITKILFPGEPEGNDIYKYLFLIHELAHVRDFRNCKYINWKTKETDLLKAEVYAEISTLKFLSQQKDDVHKLCRSLYASRLVGFQHSESILNQNVFKGVVKKFAHKKLKQWAK